MVATAAAAGARHARTARGTSPAPAARTARGTSPAPAAAAPAPAAATAAAAAVVAPAAVDDTMHAAADGAADGDDEDDDEEAEAVSSDDDEGDEPVAQRDKFFCSANDDKPGSFWWCAPCSRCFHYACPAHATKSDGTPTDGSNKTCKQCHVQMMSDMGTHATRATRQRTR